MKSNAPEGAPTRDPADVQQLVSRCQDGDESAFSALYKKFASQIYGHLRVLLGPSEDANDALQQTFLQAFKNIHTFAGHSKFSTWLHGIAVRVALNSIRGRRRRANAMSAYLDELAGVPELLAAAPDGRVDAMRQWARLERHLEKLSPDKRTSFLLYYVEQLDLAEVAQRMGTSPDTTWARIKRARTRVLESVERDRLVEARRMGDLA